MRRIGRMGVRTTLLAAAALSVGGCEALTGPDCGRYSYQRFVDAEYGVILGAGDTSTLVSGYHPARENGSGLEATCTPDDAPTTTSLAQPGRFGWHSSNPRVVTVDARGVLRGGLPGRTLVRATTDGAPAVETWVWVVPRVAGAFVSPRDTTVREGDVVTFAAYLHDAAGAPVAIATHVPYPVNLRPSDRALEAVVINHVQPGPNQLQKRFTRAGTYPLDLVTAVRNVAPYRDAVTVTVVP